MKKKSKDKENPYFTKDRRSIMKGNIDLDVLGDGTSEEQVIVGNYETEPQLNTFDQKTNTNDNQQEQN